jgi:cation transport regulator ChaC
MIKYFAYGSNMDKEDLDKWCEKQPSSPKIKFLSVSPAKLNGFKLSFNYFSTSRHAGAANLMKAEDSRVYGLLIEIEDGDLQILRDKEGYPKYYDEIPVKVEKFNGAVVQNVKTYKVVSSRETPSHQPPTESYLQLIIKSARKYQFPDEYISTLESVSTTNG